MDDLKKRLDSVEQESQTVRYEMFGPPHAPERGVSKRVELLEKGVGPIVDLWRWLRWPLGILVAGLLSGLAGWLIDVVRMRGGG